MTVVGDVSVKLTLDMGEFQKNISKAEKSLSKVGQNMKDVGKKMSTALTLPLTGLAVATVKVGADFEQSMKKVEAVTGASAKDMAILEKTARDFGKTTKFSAGQVADAMGFLGMAGFKTNQILDATGGMLNLASISGMDLAKVADITSNMLSGLGLEASEAGRMTDVMAKTLTNSNVDVAMLGETFKYVAPTAKDLGLGLEELSASIGILGDSGIQGSMAGTSLATGLTRLAAPTSEAQRVMDKLGMSFFDTEGNMKGMPDILKELETGMAGMTSQQKISTLATLFGQESMKSWSVLLGAGSEKVANYADELSNSSGEAQRLADVMNDTLYGRIDSLKSAMADVGISIYKDFEAPLKKILETCTDWVRKFGELDESTRRTIVVIAGISAIIPPIVIALGMFLSSLGTVIGTFGKTVKAVGKVSSAFNTMRKALNLTKLLPLVTSPVGLIILALAGLIAIGVLVWKNWDEIKAKTIEIWDSVAGWLSDTWNSIKDYCSETWESIKSGVVDTWNSIYEYLSGILSDIVSFYVDTWTRIINDVKDAWSTIIKTIKKYGSKLYEASGLKAFVDYAVHIFKFLKDTLTITMEMIFAIFKAIWDKIRATVSDIISKLVAVIDREWTKVKIFTTTIWNAIKDFIKSVWNAIWSVISPVVEKIVYAVTTAWDKVKSTTTTVYNAIKAFITSVWESIKSAIKTAVDAIWNVVSTAWNKVKSTTTEIFNAVKSSVVSIWDGMKNAITEKANSIWSSVKAIFGKVKNAIVEPIEKARDLVKNALDAITGFFKNLSWKFPTPKMPRFSVSKGSATFLGQEIPVPKFNIEWNAKGNIFNGASILGGGQGVGEAGAEVVMPIQRKRYMKPYASMVADLLHQYNGGTTASAGITQNITINSPEPLSPSEVARKTLQGSRRLAMEWGIS